MEEKWKDIIYKNTENISVSNFGKVKRGNKLLNIYENHDGYSVVSLKSDKPKNPWRSISVGILVGLAFIPKPNDSDEFEINHKDYNRKNNNVNNLEWLTHADNVRYSVCNKPDLNGKNNPNYGNKKLSKIYSQNKEYAKEKQSRGGLKNGRCRKIRMYNDNFSKDFSYIRECMEYLIENNIVVCKSIESIRKPIGSCIKENKSYKGYYFEMLD